MKPVNIGVVRELLMAMPDVEEGEIHGVPSFRAGGKMLTCPAIHKSAEPDTLVVWVPSAERERLMAAEPRRYYVTEHYRQHPVVLVRMSETDRKSLRTLLERAWLLLCQGRSGARST